MPVYLLPIYSRRLVNTINQNRSQIIPTTQLYTTRPPSLTQRDTVISYYGLNAIICNKRQAIIIVNHNQLVYRHVHKLRCRLTIRFASWFARTAKCATRLAFARNYQVTVVGGAGGVGQPLSMLLKTNPLVSKLVIHDIHKRTHGVALDISYIPSSSCVEGHAGEGNLEKALKGANIVVVAAGNPPKKGVCDAELLKLNAPAIAEVMKKIATSCPCALVAIITDPINSMVPFASEVLQKNGGFDQRKLFGVTTVNLIAAQVLLARAGGIPEVCASVPVIGGNSRCTILPLFSQATPCCEKIKPEHRKELVSKVRNVATDIINAKGEGGAAISMAYAANMFVEGLLQALAGSPNVQYSYVQNNDFGTCFFSSPVLLDCQGVYETQMVPMLSKLECELLEVTIDQLRKDVLHGQVLFSEMSGKKGCDKPC